MLLRMQLGTATNVTAAAPAVAPVIAPTAPAPAPVVEAPAPAGAAPMGVIEELVYTPPGACPSPVITDLPAGVTATDLHAQGNDYYILKNMQPVLHQDMSYASLV